MKKSEEQAAEGATKWIKEEWVKNIVKNAKNVAKQQNSFNLNQSLTKLSHVKLAPNQNSPI